MIVEFTQRWRNIMPGMQVELAEGVAKLHIERGRAKIPETAEKPKRKRGRPRKVKNAEPEQQSIPRSSEVGD